MPKKKDNNKETDNSLINFYSLPKMKKFMPVSHNPNYGKTHFLKVPFRASLIGSSGSGKSLLFMNILSRMPDTFNRLFIYTRAEEPLYNYLQSVLADDLLTVSYDLNDFVNYPEENYYGNTLIVFDDYCNEKKNSPGMRAISEMYIRGRKLGISLIFISQSYYKIEKLIRLQCQVIFLKKTGCKKDLKMLLTEYSLNCTTEQLLKMYNKCSEVFEDFLLIDLNASQNDTFRHNFLQILDPKDFN